MSVLCRGKTSASSRWLRQCVSHTKSPFIQPAQSFGEAVDVPVVLHDRQKVVSSTGPVHWQDRRFPSCVATPSTNNPDDTAKVKVSQGQPDRFIPAPSEALSVYDQPGKPEDCETTQRQTAHDRFRSSRKSKVPQVVQRQCRSPNDPESREDPTGPIHRQDHRGHSWDPKPNSNHPEPTAAVGGHSDSLSDPVADENF